MGEQKGKTMAFDLGRSGTITCHISEDAKRLLISFDTRPEGLSKSGLNGFIEALKKVRDKMDR